MKLQTINISAYKWQQAALFKHQTISNLYSPLTSPVNGNFKGM